MEELASTVENRVVLAWCDATGLDPAVDAAGSGGSVKFVARSMVNCLQLMTLRLGLWHSKKLGVVPSLSEGDSRLRELLDLTTVA